MKILSMEVYNFLSVGYAKFDFRDAGLVLVEGKNGAGKSTLIDALVWCLHGKTLRGYENDQVVNRKAGEDCCVAVNLVKVEGAGFDVAYQVRRARKHSEYKNSLTLIQEDVDISGASVTETQALVEKVLGCTLRTFLSCVVFGQNRAYRFSSLTDKEQKDILDEMLGVERFAKACVEARAQASALRTTVETTRSDLQRVERENEHLAADLKELREKNTAFEGDVANKLAAQREKLRDAKKKAKSAALVDVKTLRKARSKADEVVTKLSDQLDECREIHTKADIAWSILKEECEDLNQQLKDHRDTCPTCDRPFDAAKNKKHVANLKREIGEVADKFAKAKVTADEAGKLYNKVKLDLTKARENAREADAEVNKAFNAEADVKLALTRVDELEDHIEELKKETNPYVDLILKVEMKLEKSTSNAAFLKSQLEAHENDLDAVMFWVDAFGAKGLRSLLLDSALPVLNREAARVSRALTGGAVKIEFSAQSELKSGKTVEKFEVKVENRDGAGDYEGNSSGEKAKVDLCVGLALQKLVASRTSASFNVAMFDEAFDHIDHSSHERIVNVLADLDKESVYVISHDPDLQSFFPATISVSKREGFSVYET